MPEPLRHRERFWSPAPDRDGRITRDGWSARMVSGLGQVLASGDLDAARAALAPDAVEAGLWSLCEADAVMARIARDKALFVTTRPLAIRPGWHDGGFAASPADDLYAVVELEGAGLEELVAEAVSADLRAPSPSAAVMFAGVPGILYRRRTEVAWLHVESPLAAYLWSWLERR